MSNQPLILDFLNGTRPDTLPFMPIFMRFAARFSKVPYRDFCLDTEAHCLANRKTAEAFSSDWVNVMSDPYAESEVFGAKIHYPEDGLPQESGHALVELDAFPDRSPAEFLASARIAARIEQIAFFRRNNPGNLLICGWVEGPLAEYCDLRGMSDAFLDLYDQPENVHAIIDKTMNLALLFVEKQIQAGAHCIGIGDAACSQCGLEFYREFAFQWEKKLVEQIHQLGAIAKLHICGNTTAILPDMIATGADIVDIDHLVTDMTPFVPLLAPHQKLCGNLDPVGIIQNMQAEQIKAAAAKALTQAPGKLILSGGCEITPDTPPENILALAELAQR
ncbi:MAG: uroporphyrinogen decarboxylase family protein [Lentisphaeria bacterium]|jgi:uroporphyrinogen decarboxylase|nr:uroporphyrinogen decarboxylase family protein [Lentisphaeria bacterium]